ELRLEVLRVEHVEGLRQQIDLPAFAEANRFAHTHVHQVDARPIRPALPCAASVAMSRAASKGPHIDIRNQPAEASIIGETSGGDSRARTSRHASATWPAW